MAVLERNDGALFVTPGYREVLSAKKKALLKKEIQMLSENYGQYVYLRRKSATQYEAAFSQEAGYPLGETVAHYFEKPADLIYCEELPEKKEAILVIIKNGSVYLDTKLPLEDVTEELIALRSQKNKFQIVIYGNVPLSEKPSTTKFFFDTKSIASFTVLEESLFSSLPVNATIQLLPLNAALSAAGMGPIPIKKIVTYLCIIAACYAGWNYLITHKKKLPTLLVRVVDPYSNYMLTMTSPNPAAEITSFTNDVNVFYSSPGASMLSATLSVPGNFSARINPNSVNLSLLHNWAVKHNIDLTLDAAGVTASLKQTLPDRPAPQSIYNLQSSLRIFVDRIKMILPDANSITLSTINNYSAYQSITAVINFGGITTNTLQSIGKQLSDLPIILSGLSVTMNEGLLSGKITLTIMGN